MSERNELFRKFLLKLSNQLGKVDVKRLKFLAGFGDRVAEQCEEALDVFEELRRSGKIASDNLTYLKEFLFDEEFGRRDLIDIVGSYLHICSYFVFFVSNKWAKRFPCGQLIGIIL